VRRLGAALIVFGLCAAAFGMLWELGVVPGSRVVLPAPVAIGQPAYVPPTRVPTSPPAPTVRPAQTALLVPTPGVVHLAAADATERAAPFGTYAVRLTIPSIKVDTEVQQAGVVDDADGEPIWETRPFVAVHYGDLTSRLGTPGNAVIAGHVVTVSEGNVFRFLYQLDPGDDIHIWDDVDQEHDYAVEGVRLVPPSDTSVMQATPDETLTLITCGGTFDPHTREFSDRLIVTAKPV
jgi:LPXTG-site transpeptidase (sortase) family protein